MDTVVETPIVIERPFMDNASDIDLIGGRDELIKRFLQKEGNVLYSPATIYMALCVLGNITIGESQQEVLQVLGISKDNIDNLANELAFAFNKDIVKRDVVRFNKLSKSFRRAQKENIKITNEKVSNLSSSLWLSDRYKYHEEKLNNLKNAMDIETYIGDPSSDMFNDELKEWINNKTNNLLLDSVDTIKLDRQMALAIFSALYFKAKWDGLIFDTFKTRKDNFYIENDKFIKADFMRTKFATAIYHGKNYSCISLPLEGDFNIKFVLPDEEIKPRELLNNKEVLAFISKEAEKIPSNSAVILKIPKIDISANIDLMGALKELGFKKIVTENNEDFKELCEERVQLNDGKQLNRIIVKEGGVEIASVAGFFIGHTASAPTTPVEFKLDRPFIVSVTGKNTSIPLMVGVIDNPKI